MHPTFLGTFPQLSELMSDSNKERGVFLYDDPTVDKLKSCALFWKNVIVFEGYLTDIDQQPELLEPSLKLFQAGVLRICTDEDLRDSLHDKIYYGLDKRLWEYLYRHADNIAVNPKMPENAEEIIAESTKRDNQNEDLQKLLDKSMYDGYLNEWMRGLKENERIPYESMPPDLKKEMTEVTEAVVKMQWDHFFQNDSPTRFGFEHRNRYLLEQMSVSSAIYAPARLLPYYSHKLGDYSIRDARKYLSGLNAVMPFVKRTSIDSFSLEDILRIRRKREWAGAMERLSELCNEIKSGADMSEFSKELQSKVITEYQDALDEKLVTWKDLAGDSAKNSAYTGISFIPIVGPIISAAAGAVDPIISYFREKADQKTLPVFLNDLRKFKS
jgi:hypothetical protein